MSKQIAKSDSCDSTSHLCVELNIKSKKFVSQCRLEFHLFLTMAADRILPALGSMYWNFFLIFCF